jgi:hypothetical protein
MSYLLKAAGATRPAKRRGRAVDDAEMFNE